MATDIRVLVVDDHPLFREGVIATLSRGAGFQVVAEAASTSEAVAQARATQPDVVLLDVGLPDGPGTEAIARILGACPETRVVMLTVSEDSDTVIAALRAGAAGYVLKGTSGRELLSALRSVVRGEPYTSPEAARRVLAELSHPRRPIDASLTPRERSVFQQLSHGLTNREISVNLGLSEKTVKRHVTVLMQKLGVRNRVEAALLASQAERESRRP